MGSNNMMSYSRHVMNDMHDVLALVVDEHGDDAARYIEQVKRSDKKQIDDRLQEYNEMICEFIRRSTSQRQAYLNKITKHIKDEKKETQLYFVALCLIRLNQIHAFIEVRDMHRNTITPGNGNRVTAAGMCDLLFQTQHILGEHEIPWEIYDNLDIDLDDEDETDDDFDDDEN
jgi:vacuolar-type H+-ATPase subunit H